MQNFDIMSLLPLLSGGGNKDMSSILSAMGKTAPAPQPSPTPQQNSGGTGNRPYPDFSKLYPNTPLSDMPRANEAASSPSGGKPDMSTIMQLMAAMNANKKPPTSQPTQDFAPTATKEIRATLRTILDLNCLNTNTSEQKPNVPPTKKSGS